MTQPWASTPLWSDHDDTEVPIDASLAGDADVDVAIVGAGFTGLWTALHLIRADPHLRIAVIEAHQVGYGASGRNGGWCSAILPMSWASLERRHGQAATVAMQRAMFDTVDAVLADLASLGIDARAHKGGWVHHATNPAQVARLHAELAEARRLGFGEADFAWLDRHQARARVAAAGTLGSIYSPHCAVLDPGRAVRGLARALTRAGVAIYARTPVHTIEPGRAVTANGTVTAEVVVRGTEAYGVKLAGQRRSLVPLYSLMVATEVLDETIWSELGWHHREAFSDARHLLVYAQRTADDRIAFGGRGAPYHFASAIEARFDHDDKIHRHHLPNELRTLFPALAEVACTHHWGGPLGAPRDWTASVGWDRSTGLAWAGGYVGDGVATSQLAARTLADLIVGRDSDLTTLPWVGHRSRRWEPEPLRWLGINAGLALSASADHYETRHGQASRWREQALSSLLGR